MVVKATTEKIEREITGQERRFLFAPTANIALVLKVRGRITENMMNNAVRKMLITFPRFNFRMIWNKDGVEGLTTESAAEIPVKLYIRENDYTWMDVLNQEHATLIRVSEGPLTRFMLVKGEEVSEIIILCHHSISDGRSMEFAMREIILHLNNAEFQPSEFRSSPSQTPDLFPKGTGLGRIRAWFIRRINKKWNEEKVRFDEEDLLNIWESFWKRFKYCIDVIELNDDETKELIVRSRANEVTLNSTLLIAMLKARIDAIRKYDGKSRVATAVDSRKRLIKDCSDAIGFYAGASFLEFDYNQNETFWKNVQRYHKHVYKQLDANKIFETVAIHEALDQTLSDAMIIREIGKLVEPQQSRYEKIHEYSLRNDDIVSGFIERTAGNIPQIMSTNLGRLEIPDDLDLVKIERAFFTPSAGFGMEIVLGIATIGEGLTITMNYYDDYTNPENMKKVRARAEEILRGLIEQ